MHFSSDNIVGASGPVLQAIAAANGGAVPSYGADGLTAEVSHRFAAVFERDCAVFLVATGTAANALAVAHLVPPYASLLCHAQSHVMEDECGAPEFFSAGAKLTGLAGVGGLIAPQTLEAHLDGLWGGPNQPPPRALSLSQASEFGQVYALDQLKALSSIAHKAGLAVHMDGARFANALVSLGCTPAEMTWKAGVDVLSFGGTKNGCLMAEAVVFFDPARAADFIYRRKRAGQTLSKHRLIAAQFGAYFENDHWLDLARHANAMARELGTAVAASGFARLAWPVMANEVFVILPRAVEAALRAAGAQFYDWSEAGLPPGEKVAPGERLIRLVTSFATTREEVAAFGQALADAAKLA